jgi:hypothetical protein
VTILISLYGSSTSPRFSLHLYGSSTSPRLNSLRKLNLRRSDLPPKKSTLYGSSTSPRLITEISQKSLRKLNLPQIFSTEAQPLSLRKLSLRKLNLLSTEAQPPPDSILQINLYGSSTSPRFSLSGGSTLYGSSTSHRQPPPDSILQINTS